MEQQDKRTPITQLMAETIRQIRAMADADTIIGSPIRAEGVTLIPVSRMSIGVGSGGSEFSTKKQQPGGENAFGGGGAASAKLEPVAFLIVKGDNVRLLPVAPGPGSAADRVIELVPEVVDKITSFVEKQQEKRQEQRQVDEGDLAD